jgi:hypothetical protein
MSSTTAKNNQYFVLNDVAASAADLTTPGGGRVKVTGDTQGFLRPKVDSFKINRFIVETLAIKVVAATATVAAGTTYRFGIKQQLGTEINGVETHYIDYLAPTGVTATIFREAITGQVQGLIDSGKLQATAVVYTSGNSGVTITALTGYPVIEIVQTQALTVTSGLASGASTSTDFSAVAATGVITMEVAATTGLVVGQLHTLSGWTGGALINGKTAAQGATVRVSAILTGPARVQYVAQSVSADITGQDSNYALIASYATGKGSQLIALGITGGGDPNVDVVSTNVYHECIVTGGEPSGQDMTLEPEAPFAKHYYINSGDADALDLVARFVEVQNWYGAGVTTVDPALL